MRRWSVTPEDFACLACRRALKEPTPDGLGPICRIRIHGKAPRRRSSRAVLVRRAIEGEDTMLIDFEELEGGDGDGDSTVHLR